MDSKIISSIYGNPIVDESARNMISTFADEMSKSMTSYDDTSIREEMKTISDSLDSINELFKSETIKVYDTDLNDAIDADYAVILQYNSFLKEFLPIFNETGEYQYQFIYDDTGNGFSSLTDIRLDERVTLNTNEPVPVNRIMTPNIGIIIRGLGTCRVKYKQKTENHKIVRVSNGAIIQMLPDFILAGTYIFNSSDILTKEDANEKYATKEEVNHSNLYGKNILVIGDSMVYGHTLGRDKTWLAKLAARNNMTAINNGTNGAYMSDHQYNNADNSVYRKVCAPGGNYYISDEIISKQDYILIFAGTNDIEKSINLGSVGSTNREDFSGAINAICTTLQTRAPKAHIGFITPYKIRDTYPSYIEAIENVCEKYGIPVFNNAKRGGINYSNKTQISTLTLSDGYHLNETGMEFASYKYEGFLLSI